MTLDELVIELRKLSAESRVQADLNTRKHAPRLYGLATGYENAARLLDAVLKTKP